MSINSDLYLSTRTKAADYLTNAPISEEDRVLHSDITIVELSILWTLLEKREWEPGVLSEFECVAQRPNGGCMIHQLPSGFVIALSRVQPLQLGVISLEWATTPELATTPSALAPFVQSLVRLAARALKTGQGVFLLNRLPEDRDGVRDTH